MSAPPKGNWIDEDWQEDIFCATSGFNIYRSAVEFDPNPVTEFENIGLLSCQCYKNCGAPEVEDYHEVKQTISKTEGWSIGGSFGGNTGDLMKALQLSLSINASYSESTTVSDEVSHKFPHGSKDGHFTRWRVAILHQTDTYTGRVTKYYQNAVGRLLSTTTNMGTVTITRHSTIKGMPRFEDFPCSEWEEPLIYRGGSKTISRASIPRNLRSVVEDYTPDSRRFALGVIAETSNLDLEAQILLNAALNGDNATFANFIEEHGEELESLAPRDPRRWIVMHRHWLFELPEDRKVDVKESFGLVT
jgi:hypothetical protein